MKIHDKLLIKTATDVQSQLEKYRIACFDESNRLSVLATADLDRLRKLRNGLGICRRRRWPGACKILTHRILRIVRDFPPLLDSWDRSIQTDQEKLPGLRELVEDLYQIQQEFGRLEINRAESTLSVFTDSIELEDIYLGDFEIRLHLDALAHLRESDAFRVIALNPQCAAGNDLVTHPHVSDETLCMGDATVPIRKALSSGRLCDALLLVKSVLETYNPASPYVALNQWEGYPCNNCNDHMVEDDSCYCDYCEHDYCSDCFESCNVCQTGRCQDCMSRCSTCEETICHSCLAVCEECSDDCCKDCLKNELCPTCKEERDNENEEENENNNATKKGELFGIPDPALLPDCLGQAALFSRPS